MAPTVTCDCSAEKQTVHHMIKLCLIRHNSNRDVGLRVDKGNFMICLSDKYLTIYVAIGSRILFEVMSRGRKRIIIMARKLYFLKTAKMLQILLQSIRLTSIEKKIGDLKFFKALVSLSIIDFFYELIVRN